MGKKKSKSKKIKFNLIDWLDQYIFTRNFFACLIVLFLLFKMIDILYWQARVTSEGVETKGYVYRITSPPRGGTLYWYRYLVPGSYDYYYGKTNHPYSVGDSIPVKYLPSSPKHCIAY